MPTSYIIATCFVPSVLLVTTMIVRYFLDKHTLRKKVRKYSKQLSNCVVERTGEIKEVEVLW